MYMHIFKKYTHYIPFLLLTSRPYSIHHTNLNNSYLPGVSTVQTTKSHHDVSGEGLMVSGMNFSLFCKSIMYMALLGYRTLDAAVPTVYKVSWQYTYVVCVDGLFIVNLFVIYFVCQFFPRFV